MTFPFSQRSQDNLAQCDPRLERIAREAIKHVDFGVICGRRDKVDQNRLFDEGKTQVKFPDSKHNKNPSQAFDLFPSPYDWNDREAFIRFAAFILGIAAGMGYSLRWGGDWNKDWDLKDNRFNDWPHFELFD